MARKMTIEHCEPRMDIGRCEVCSKELATRILSIENIHEHRFCDKCWSAFASMVANDSNRESM